METIISPESSYVAGERASEGLGSSTCIFVASERATSHDFVP